MTNAATRFQPDISGNAVPSGFVGEKITWASAPSNWDLSNESENDWTNASIVLTPGRFLILANISCYVWTGTTAGYQTELRIKITDSSNVVVQNQNKVFYINNWDNAGGRYANVKSSLSFSFVADIGTNTTYKIRAIMTGTPSLNGGASLFNGTSGTTSYSEFFAVRLA